MKRLIVNGLALWLFCDIHPVSANEALENPCVPILTACEDRGFINDAIARTGQKIWADCANPIIDRNQKIRGITIEPGRIKLCRQYKLSRNYPVDTD
jgi:hypothetical protein